MKHTVGSWYKCDNEYYILAQVAGYQFCLIGLNGNRWNDPIHCKLIDAYPQTLSEEDFIKVAETSYLNVQFVKTAIPNRLLEMLNDCSVED